MKITVCELPNDPAGFSNAWVRLVDHVREYRSDLVLLPEMPFYRWLAQTDNVDPEEWDQSVAAHEKWIGTLS